MLEIVLSILGLCAVIMGIARERYWSGVYQEMLDKNNILMSRLINAENAKQDLMIDLKNTRYALEISEKDLAVSHQLGRIVETQNVASVQEQNIASVQDKYSKILEAASAGAR